MLGIRLGRVRVALVRPFKALVLAFGADSAAASIKSKDPSSNGAMIPTSKDRAAIRSLNMESHRR